MPLVPCSLCGEEGRFKELWLLQDRLWPSDSRFVLGRCTDCGLVYLNPRLPQHDLEQYYPPQYYSQPYKEHAPSFYRRYSLIDRYKKGGRILDVGCSNGAFLTFMETRGWDVYGLDNSRGAIEIAAQHHGNRVTCAVLPEADYPSDYFDVVSLFEVFEHISEPSAYLEEIYRILKSGGVLCLSVPNFSCWERKLFGRWWIGLDAPRHLYQYTPATLRRMIERAGLNPVVIRSLNAHRIQNRRSRIDYCRNSLRFFLGDMGLYPKRTQEIQDIGQTQENMDTRGRALMKLFIHLAEGAVFYPFWFFSRITDRDNTIWVIAGK